MKMEFSVVPITPIPAPEVDEVTLTLSFDEAKALRAVVGGIAGGGPVRKVTSAIYDALEKIPGIPMYQESAFRSDRQSPTLDENYEI